ncbi:hypothetical protein Hanom_Chr04g00344811 [Helianthus anomalus]
MSYTQQQVIETKTYEVTTIITWSPRSLKDNFLSRDHSQPSTNILMNSITKLSPGAPPDSALTVASTGKLTSEHP